MVDYPNELESGELPVIPYQPAEVVRPMDAAETEHHRRERQRKLKLAVVSSILTRPLAVVIPILVISLFAKPLGTARYGLYEAVGGFVMFLGMTNLGLTMGLQNKLTDCAVSGDFDLARRYTSSLFFWLMGMMVLSMLVFTIIVPFVNWQVLFPIDDPVGIKETPMAVWVAGMAMLAGLVISLPGTVYGAYQEMHRANLWEGAAKIATVVGCIVAAICKGGVVAVLLAVSGTATFVRFINMANMFLIEKKWIRPRFSDFEWRLLRGTMSQGILLFVLQLSNLLLFSLDKQIISMGLGVAAVTNYGAIGRFFVAAYGVYMLLLTPLWPASGEAVRRGDIAWVKRSLRWSLMVGWLIAAGVGVIMYFGGDFIFHTLTRGSTIQNDKSIVLALTASFVLRAWVDSRSMTLNSTGVLIPQIVFYTGHAVLNVIVAILVVKPFGAAGVAWSTPITALVTSTWGYPWMMKKYIFSRAQSAAVTSPVKAVA